MNNRFNFCINTHLNALLFLIFSIFFCFPIIIDEIEKEEYQVYSHFLIQIEHYRPNPELLVFKERTSDWIDLSVETLKYFEKKNKIELDDELIEDFSRKNEISYTLENKFSVPQKIVLVTEQELKGISWALFYIKYPESSGRYEFSRVAFSKDATQAILYFGYLADRLVGAGNIYLLLKENDEWIIKDQLTIWVS